MRKLLFILVVLPTLLWGQQNNANQAIKKNNCETTISNKYHNKDTVPLSETGNLTVSCGKVISFIITLPVTGDFVSYYINGSGSLISISDVAPRNGKFFYVACSKVEYKTSTGQTAYAKGITIVVKNNL